MPHPGLPDTLPPDFFAAITHLESLERLDLDSLKLMVLLETAGEPLYESLAALAPDEETRALMRANGREEVAHATRLAKAIEILSGEPFEIPPLSENPYAEPPPFGALTPDLLQQVQEGERQGDRSYRRYAKAEPNEEVAALLRQNGEEEARHAKRVARVAELLSAA